MPQTLAHPYDKNPERGGNRGGPGTVISVMTNIRVVLAAVFALGVLPLAGCARATVGGASPADVPSHPADAVVLRVGFEGGLAGPAASATQVPLISVYGDGRVVTQGPTIEIYPAPALPNVQVQHVSPADVAKLVRLALDAGVGAGTDLGVPRILDAPLTRFTVLADGGTRTTDVPALREAGEDAAGLTAAQRAARAKLVHLLDQLTDLPKTLGSGAVDEAKPFQGAGLAAIAQQYRANDQSTEPPAAELAWPGPALPGEPLGGATGLGCVTATGDALAKVLDAAKQANAATRWMSGGKPWSVTLRPMLPDESGCADLTKP